MGKKNLETRDLAITILKAKGIDHDEWLNSQYSKVIAENTTFLMECLKSNINKIESK